MEINKKRIQEKLHHLSIQILHLNEILSTNTPEEFKQSWQTYNLAERIIEIIMQIIIDICTHIVASLDQAPQTYSGCMEVLKNKGILDLELSNNLIDAVKMRNLIVHQYEVIDYERLFSLISKLITDSEAYKNSILDWIKKIE